MQLLTNTWDAQLYNDKHSFVYGYGTALIDMLDPKKGERILDLGCGAGQLTSKIKALCSEVVGIDSATEMIENAREQFPLIDFRVADAVDYHFKEKFDAIFSNATLHWVIDHKKAIACMFENLREGGRIALEFGGKDNVEAITDQLRKTLRFRGYEKQADLKVWYFPSIGEYTSALEDAGFTVTFAEWYDRLTPLVDTSSGIIDWLAMFGSPFFKVVADHEVEAIRIEVQENLTKQLFKQGVWYADYKRIRVLAVK
tara:strand:- start:477 stop:1244 length:768 start_codon:yes stop_codon:yes gene_type:complete